MEVDISMFVIFGRPFVATVAAIIDVKCGKLKLQVGEKAEEFNLNDMVKYPSFTHDLYYVDIIEKLTQKSYLVNFDYDPLECCL